MVPAIAPGVYVLIAERADGGGDQYGYKATQWLVVTDLGLTTMSGADGLNVFVRSLNSGRALDRITVKLYARNNEELASVVTDRSGLASFPPGLMRGSDGRTATALMAFRRDGDFAFLDLTRAAFDLSDRGVGGRLAPRAADAFLYADRGVYRPGETVHLGALLRDASAEALSGLPLTLKLIRPDEVEAHSYSLADQGAGGYALDIPISTSARTGSWTVQAYLDPKGEAVGSLSFLVEDVVPARIEAKLINRRQGHQAGRTHARGAREQISLRRAGGEAPGQGDPHHRAGQRPLPRRLPGLPVRARGRKGRSPKRGLRRPDHRRQGRRQLRHDALGPAQTRPSP